MSKKKSVKLLRILNEFKDKCKEYEPRDYKSYSILRKINKSFSIKLMFGYTKGRNPIYSEEVEIDGLDLAVTFMVELDNGLRLDVATKNIFDGIDEEDE